MYFLVYVSHSNRKWEEQELEKLLHKARANNSNNGISGMLLFLQERFIQVLEGDKKKVDDLYETIKVDSRHRSVSILLQGEMDQRIFSNWTMGFQSLKVIDGELTNGFTSLEEFMDEVPLSNPVLNFLRKFYDKNYLSYVI